MIFELLRPKQWVKNLFVFLPMAFGGRIFSSDAWIASAEAFAAFCLAASAVYCLNDVIDVEDDRRHPRKCRRPVASGRISVPVALGVMALLAVVAVLLPVMLGRPSVGWIIGAYLILNVAYCLKLKQFAIVDVSIIALGFVLRVAAGGFAGGIVLSPWIVCMTFLITLFLAFAKRRDDVVIYLECGEVMRRNTLRYNLAFVNQAMGILGTTTIVCYLMYCVSPEVTARLGNDYVYITSLFVICGLLRYMQVAMVDNRSGSPTDVLLHDRFVQACIVGWLITFSLILYY